MELERVPGNCLDQKIGMLKLGRHVDDRYFFPPYQLPEEVVQYVDALGAGVSNGVLRKLHSSTLIVLKYRYAWYADSRQHETPNVPQEQDFLYHISKRHVLCLR